MKKIFLLLIVLFAAHGAFGQTTLASWSFEGVTFAGTGSQTPSLTAGLTTADGGAQPTGSAFTGSHASASTVWSTPAGNGSTKSFSSNNWAVGDYLQFQFKTTAFNGISVTWDQTGSGTGPKDFKVQYSTDGTSFVDAPSGTYAVNLNSTWSSATPLTGYTTTVDLSSITALNNQPNVYIRLVNTTTASINGGTVAAAGSSRVDNFKAVAVTTTAAGVQVSGRVTTADGRGIRNAKMTISGGSLAQPVTVVTGAKGFFGFDDIPAGSTYILSVGARRFTFSEATQIIDVMDNVAGISFVAEDGGTTRLRSIEPVRIKATRR